MTAEHIGKTCPIRNGVWNLGVNIKCLNCLGTGLTDAESPCKSPLSGKVAARYGPGIDR